MTGGSPGYNSAELLWPDGSSVCSLPDLPHEREDHTQSGLMACGTGDMQGHSQYSMVLLVSYCKKPVEYHIGTGTLYGCRRHLFRYSGW